jgi:hypothetical protein
MSALIALSLAHTVQAIKAMVRSTHWYYIPFLTNFKLYPHESSEAPMPEQVLVKPLRPQTPPLLTMIKSQRALAAEPTIFSQALPARPTCCHPRVSPTQCATPRRLRTLP